MKKFFLIALITVFCSTAIAQEESDENDSKTRIMLSIDLGSTIDDNSLGNLTKFNIGLNFAYLLSITDDVLIGGTTGLRSIFEEDEKNDSSSFQNEEGNSFIYLGVEGRLYSDNDKFYLGCDTGYAAGLYDGGIYFRPKMGFVISDSSGIFASYTQLNADSKYTTVNLGYEFSF